MRPDADPDVDDIKEQLRDLRVELKELRSQMVSRWEHQITQALVFGIVGLILTGVATSILRLVIR